MLVTFHSKASADITYFGEVAVSLLKMMGLSGEVPSALRPEDIPEAMARLKVALHNLEGEASPHLGEEDEAPAVALSQRAMPLIKLLEASRQADCHVMWDS